MTKTAHCTVVPPPFPTQKHAHTDTHTHTHTHTRMQSIEPHPLTLLPTHKRTTHNTCFFLVAVVDMSNNLNEVITAARESMATAMGAFQVQIEVSSRGGTPSIVNDRALVLLRLEKAAGEGGEKKGAVPSPEEVFECVCVCACMCVRL